LGQDHRPFDHVLQLADVTGPVVVLEPVEILGSERWRWNAVPHMERWP